MVPREPGARAAVKFILAVWEVGGGRLSDVRHFDDENLEAWKTWAARPFFLKEDYPNNSA